VGQARIITANVNQAATSRRGARVSLTALDVRGAFTPSCGRGWYAHM